MTVSPELTLASFFPDVVSAYTTPLFLVNTYSGRPGFVSYTATLTSIVGDPATRWPVANYTTPTRTSTSQLPLATGTRDDCFNYFDGSFFNVNGTSRISTCQRASDVLLVSLEDLAVWNPCETHLLPLPPRPSVGR